jgi:predicted ATPase
VQELADKDINGLHMLLRFGTANFLSIRDYQELSLVASALTDSPGEPFRVPQLNHAVLPVAAIYGANASGKSNFMAALRALRALVANSHRVGKAGSPIPVTPFRLDSESENKPTQFDIDFVHHDVRFHFSCEVTSEHVVRERLDAYPQGRRQNWYTRKGMRFNFGKNLKGENRSVESVCRDNSLFISAAVASNHEQLTEVSRFFFDSLEFFDPAPIRTTLNPKYEKYWQDKSYKKMLVALLRAADVGIVDFDIEISQPTDVEIQMRRGLNDLFRQYALSSGDATEPFTEEAINAVTATIKLKHAGAQRTVALDFGSESRGTQQYANLLMPTFQVLASGRCLLIDEIDSSLHPLISNKIIGLFHSQRSNPKQAQLIFTTHDTNLLSRDLLRRDEIWFTEKDEGATRLYPLSDIKTRKNDNIERGYLEGRYGAIPFVGDFESIFGEGESGIQSNGKAP